MIIRGLFLSLILCFCWLPACVGQKISSLDGSWLLTGGWDISPKAAPRLTLTIGAAGEDLYGEGTYQFRGCGATFLLQGKLAADGTFALSSTSVSITGTFSDGSSSTWTGSYETNFERNCTNSSGKFVAAHIESPRGTYSGKVQTYDGRTVTVSLRVTPGVFTSRPLQANSKDDGSVTKVHFTPLIGTLNIVGLRDTDGTELTATETPNSRVGGGGFTMVFPLKDGLILELGGSIKDAEANTANIMVTVWSKGKPLESGSGMLARQ